MNIQNLLSSLSQNSNQHADRSQNGLDQNKQFSSPLDALGAMLPGGLAGGAAAGGVMALLMGSKSARKMAVGVAKIGGAAVLGGLAYKAYGNWQKNKALNQTQAIDKNDIEEASHFIPIEAQSSSTPLHMALIKTMIAAAKADGEIDAIEQKHLFDAVEKLSFSNDEKAAIFGMMSRNITVEEIASTVDHEEHKAEVYLAAYLAIEVDEQSERAFLNDLAIALELPKGLPAYLEQQADQGVVA